MGKYNKPIKKRNKSHRLTKTATNQKLSIQTPQDVKSEYIPRGTKPKRIRCHQTSFLNTFELQRSFFHPPIPLLPPFTNKRLHPMKPHSRFHKRLPTSSSISLSYSTPFLYISYTRKRTHGYIAITNI